MENSTNGKCCPVCGGCSKGCCIKKILLPALLGFIFIFGYDYALHMIVLKPQYDATPNLWRTADDMKTVMPIMLLFQFLTAFALACLHAKGFSCSCKKGMCFAIKTAILLGVFTAYPYLFLPVTSSLGLYWFVGGFVKGFGLSFIFCIIAKMCRKGDGSCGTDGMKQGCG